ncbi:MAG: hypothetical protein MRERV_26c001 [Mycoplasmataceae bacterium RV_VA103A]|nr:MAG: hypothetical protein MRERV_26c001 [Mycoplasmataceae bacterium RV_VA103A]
MSNKEYKIKFHKKGLSLTSGEDKYEVRTKDHKDQVVKFAADAKNDSTAEEGIKLEYRKDGTSDKWEELTVDKGDIKYQDTFWFRGVKITKKQLKSGTELKEEVQPWAGVGFFKSRKLPFWAIVFVVALLLIGLIWWWVVSSRKEDKEEESL